MFIGSMIPGNLSDLSKIFKKKQKNTLPLQEWLGQDGPKKFYGNYIKTRVGFGLEVRMRYDEICKKLALCVEENDIPEAYWELEKFIGDKEIEIQTINKFDPIQKRYVKDHIIFNPSTIRKLVERRSSNYSSL